MNKEINIKNIDEINILVNQGVIEERFNAIKRNILKNLTLIKTKGGLHKIIDDLSNKNILVCAAGPSLEDNYKIIKKYQLRDDLRIIAIDMALKPLMLNDIKPHYAITCETTPVEFFTNLNTDSIHLLSFCGACHSNIRLWKGDMSFYNWMIYEKPYDELWKIAGDLGFVGTASVVTTQAISIALGCNPKNIIIVGNDLGYKHKYYISGNISFDKKINKLNRLNNLETINYHIILKRREYILKRDNKIYYTDYQFLTAKKWLENVFVKSAISIYDCSIPGCNAENIIKSDLKYVLEKKIYNQKRKRGKRK